MSGTKTMKKLTQWTPQDPKTIACNASIDLTVKPQSGIRHGLRHWHAQTGKHAHSEDGPLIYEVGRKHLDTPQRQSKGCSSIIMATRRYLRQGWVAYVGAVSGGRSWKFSSTPTSGDVSSWSIVMVGSWAHSTLTNKCSSSKLESEVQHTDLEGTPITILNNFREGVVFKASSFQVRSKTHIVGRSTTSPDDHVVLN
ncbi:hypothetical protein BV22DRAFT_587915 [Leucogyrophana mollusca]|uniref:Uncharacterized protein n=1 Tax=Leucogyrophana mollusca TaxID=85980 RepID=A0ACB8BD66_9AGAM|nr:hypothetical protein BV22DRAFT_587915 [Leucogyrophana mollusca]